jgi:hypothetical protein
MKNESGIEAELDSKGKIGELTVWVDEKLVAKKGLFKFPEKKKILSMVQQEM